MKKQLCSIILFSSLFLCTSLIASPSIGEKAPEIDAKTTHGDNFTLNKYRGKIIVLEWTNIGCPFVKKHYNSNNMQHLQKKYTGKGIVWIRIISSGKNKQGYFKSAAESKHWSKTHNVHATDTILDPSGEIGRLYHVKTTPEMYIINQKGILVYQGAIDSIPTTKAVNIKHAKNFVAEALDQLLKNKKITIPQTKPYGCSVKYA